MTVAFSESDISKVHVGQSATVTLDALAGVQLAAHVSSISLVGTTSSSVVSYDATLTLDQNDSRVKPGMSASAAVIIGQASGRDAPELGGHRHRLAGHGQHAEERQDGLPAGRGRAAGGQPDSDHQRPEAPAIRSWSRSRCRRSGSTSTARLGARGTLGRGLGGAGGLGGAARSPVAGAARSSGAPPEAADAPPAALDRAAGRGAGAALPAGPG